MAVWSEGRPGWWAGVRVACSWCGCRRGILPSGVLICPRCEFTSAGGPPGPLEGEVRDAPADWK